MSRHPRHSLPRLALLLLLGALGTLPAAPAGSSTALPVQQQPPLPEPDYTVEPATWSALGLAPPVTETLVAEAEAADDALSEGGAIRGRVLGLQNYPLPDVFVQVWAYNATYRSWYGQDVTVSQRDGTWRIGDLPAGRYRVEFKDEKYGHFPQFYPNKPDVDVAADVVVTEGQVTSGIDARMIYPSAMVGRLVNRQGQALAAEQVHMAIWEAAGADPFMQNNVITEQDGSFGWPRLYGGSYVVSYRTSESNYLEQWFYDGASLEEAVTIRVPPESLVTLRDFVLTYESYISGTLVNASGSPMRNGEVLVTVCNAAGREEIVARGYADMSGKYKIDHLRQGRYFVSIQAGSWDQYPRVWYPGGLSQWDAAPVLVPLEGTAANVNARVAPFGTLSGKVTLGGGLDVSRVQVALIPLPPNVPVVAVPPYSARYVSVAADGTWTVPHLPPGPYSVGFSDGYALVESEYFSNAYKAQELTPVQVGYPGDTVLPDVHIEPLTVIEGTVTRSGGVPEPDVAIDLYVEPVEETMERHWYKAVTDVNGHYRIEGIRSDRYILRFIPTRPGVSGQYWLGLPFAGPPEFLAIGPASGVLHIDAELWPTGGPIPAPQPAPTPVPTPPPTTGASVTLQPETTTDHTFTLPAGQTLQLTMTANAVRAPQLLTLGATTPPANLNPYFQSAPLAFAVRDGAVLAAEASATVLTQIPLDRLATLELAYLDSDVAGLDESTLDLLIYDPALQRWQPTGDGVVMRDAEHNRLKVQTRRLGAFALVDSRVDIHLPAIIRCTPR